MKRMLILLLLALSISFQTKTQLYGQKIELSVCEAEKLMPLMDFLLDIAMQSEEGIVETIEYFEENDKHSYEESSILGSDLWVSRKFTTREIPFTGKDTVTFSTLHTRSVFSYAGHNYYMETLMEDIRDAASSSFSVENKILSSHQLQFTDNTDRNADQLQRTELLINDLTAYLTEMGFQLLSRSPEDDCLRFTTNPQNIRQAVRFSEHQIRDQQKRFSSIGMQLSENDPFETESEKLKRIFNQEIEKMRN